MRNGIEAVVFDCYGTLVDFGDAAFADAYATICREQGLAIDGQTFYDKWMEVWRRLASIGGSSDPGSVGVAVGAAAENEPGPLSEAEPVPPQPQHHQKGALFSREMEGPLPVFRPYREEWPQHFDICFEELGVPGDGRKAQQRLHELIALAPAYPESLRVVEALRPHLRLALLSNADDDFLIPCLANNRLEFPMIVSSESAGAYKPHIAIFQRLADELALPPEKILYVGDSRVADVQGSKNAGMKAAWVNRPNPSNRSIEQGAGKRPPVEPDYEIDSQKRLLEIFELA